MAFVCKLEEDFLDLIDSLKGGIFKKAQDEHSIFEISEKRPDFESISGCDSLDMQSDDEFVFI